MPFCKSQMRARLERSSYRMGRYSSRSSTVTLLMFLPVDISAMPLASLRAVIDPRPNDPWLGRSRIRVFSEIEESGMIQDHSTPPRNNRGANHVLKWHRLQAVKQIRNHHRLKFVSR